jgi:hypothetical protein
MGPATPAARLQEAQLSTDRAQRRAQQSATLEALFEVFFRALKQATASALLAPGRKGAPRCACMHACVRQERYLYSESLSCGVCHFFILIPLPHCCYILCTTMRSSLVR